MANLNTLLMIAEDLGKQLGCYGNTKIQTQTLDQLACGVTKFNQAFTSTASCSVGHSVAYTSLYTHQNGQYGIHNNRHPFTNFGHAETANCLSSKHSHSTCPVVASSWGFERTMLRRWTDGEIRHRWPWCAWKGHEIPEFTDHKIGGIVHSSFGCWGGGLYSQETRESPGFGWTELYRYDWADQVMERWCSPVCRKSDCDIHLDN